MEEAQGSSPCSSTITIMEQPLSFREPKLPEVADLRTDLTFEEFCRHRLAAQLDVNALEITPDFLERLIDLTESPFIGDLHSADGHNHPVTPEQEEKIRRIVVAHPLRGFISGEYTPPDSMRQFSRRVFDDDRRYVRELIDRVI
jgi:hypothetical protein